MANSAGFFTEGAALEPFANRVEVYFEEETPFEEMKVGVPIERLGWKQALLNKMHNQAIDRMSRIVFPPISFDSKGDGK